MSDNEAKIAIVADASGVAPGTNEAKAAIQSMGESAATATASMRGSFASVSTSVREMGVTIRETVGVIGEMREAMMDFGEAMLAAFAVEKVADWAKEMGEGAEKVAHTAEILGMTTPEVQGLQAAATATGISIDTLTKGLGILDKNMIQAASGTGTAAVAFKAIGISAGDGKTQMELLLSIADKFKDMADGPKKVALAMELFGRAGKEMIPFLDMGSAGIEKLDQKSQEYSAGVLVATAANQELRDWLDQVNERGVALAESTNETKIAMQGVSNVMTDAFAPILKEATDGINTLIEGFIESYREGGAVAVILEALSGTLQMLGDILQALWEIWLTVWDAIKELIGGVVSAIADGLGVKVPSALNTSTAYFNIFKDVVTVAKDIIIAAIDLIAGAVEGLASYLKSFAKIAYDAFTLNWGAIAADWQAGVNKLVAIVADAAKKIRAEQAEMTAAVSAGMQGKALGGAGGGIHEPKGFGSFDPDLTKPTKAKKPHKAKAAPEDKDDSATTDLEEAKDDAAAKLAIAESNATTIEELAKLSAQEQLDAVQKAENAGVITKKQAIAQKVAILATEVQAEITAANTIYQAKVAALKQEEAADIASLAAKQTALDKSNKDYATKFQNLQNQIEAAEIKTNDQLEVLATQHENQLTTINAKGIAARAAAEVKDVSQRAQMEKTAINSISQSWSSALAQMATGQATFAKTIQSLYMGMVNVISGALSNMLEKWMQQQLTAFIFGRTQQAATGTAQVTSNAAIAGAAAFASIAAIPIIGPAMAPGAAAAAFAGAMSFAPLASAFGGWGSVPYDGAMTELHKEEMVLPANLASPLRSMLTSGSNDNSPGGGMSAGGGDTYHIHATDADSFQRMLSSEAGQNGIKAGLQKARAGLKF